ncbi:MAG: DUF6798 domain-containing protein [Bacteroidota bacterium]
MKTSITKLVAYLSIYGLVLARWGYEYGRNDQMQILGYAKYLADKSLFPVDNYIQGMAAKVPNERFTFSWIMSWSGSLMELVCLIGHLVTTLLMFHLLYRIASRFIKTDYLIWLCILFIFIPLYNINLGGNELWYNTFFVSNVVKLIGLWAILLFLDKKWLLSMLVIGLSTLLQPVVGVQLFVTFTGIMMAMKLFERAEMSWSTIFSAVGIFMITGGVWVIFLKLFFEEASEVSNEMFFNILFEFRSPHHYLPFDFSQKGYIILLPLMIFGLVYFWGKEKILAWFFTISCGLMVGYVVMVEGFSVVNVASLQWFKVTIWLEAFSVMALFAFAERQIKFLGKSILQKLALPVLSVGGLAAIAILIFRSSLFPWEVPMDFGQQHTHDAAVEICIQAKAKTSQSALFIHPMAFTELKVYGERSSFIEWKILVHRKNAMKDWYDRLSRVYSISLDAEDKGFALYKAADHNYSQLTTDEVQRLADEFGITHMITWKDHLLDFDIVAENPEFWIYEINQAL